MDFTHGTHFTNETFTNCNSFFVIQYFSQFKTDIVKSFPILFAVTFPNKKCNNEKENGKSRKTLITFFQTYLLRYKIYLEVEDYMLCR